MMNDSTGAVDDSHVVSWSSSVTRASLSVRLGEPSSPAKRSRAESTRSHGTVCLRQTSACGQFALPDIERLAEEMRALSCTYVLAADWRSSHCHAEGCG